MKLNKKFTFLAIILFSVIVYAGRTARYEVFEGDTGNITTVNSTTVTSTTVNGGNLRLSGNSLISTDSNGNININPDGTGLTVFTDLTASRVPYLGASSELLASSVTSTELGYLSGVTSALQTQLDAKLDDFTGSADNLLLRTDGASGNAIQESGITVSDADAISGVTDFTVDNLNLNGNSFSSTSGNINITPASNTVFTTGFVGIGSAVTPTEELHIQATNATLMLDANHPAGTPTIAFRQNGNTYWNFYNESGTNDMLFRATYVGGGGTATARISQKGVMALGTASYDASSQLEVSSTSKGSRPFPWMTEAQRDAITSPATGLGVYNTDTNKYNFYNGTSWEVLGALSNPMTTAEDIIVGGASGAPTRLAIGSNGDVLGVVSGALTYLKNLNIVQIQYATYATEQTTTSTSFSDTNLTVSITPTSTSNRILVFASIPCQATSASSITNYYIEHKLYRGGVAGTQITAGHRQGITLGSSAANYTAQGSNTIMAWDDPASVSSTAYTIAHASGSASATAKSFYANQTGWIIAVEIAN